MILGELEFSQFQLLIGIAIGALIFSLAFVLGRRSGYSTDKVTLPPTPWTVPISPFSDREIVTRTFEEEIKEWDTILQGIQSEKRRSVRLKGSNLEVEIVVKESGEALFGIVLDRSITGLRLAVDKTINPGIRLKVRAVNLDPPMLWQEIKVVRTHSVGRSGWEIGCEFVTPPTWKVMMQFG